MTHLSGRRMQLLFVGALSGLALAGCSDDPSVSPSTNMEVAIVETAPPDTTLTQDATPVTTTTTTTTTTITTTTTTTLPPQGPASTLDGPVVTADPTGGIGEEAAVYGVLVLEGGCLLLRDGEQVDVPVWQSGTTWDPTASEVILPDGGRVSLGDEIGAGGGGRPGGGLIRDVSSLEGRKLAEQCARSVGSGVFVIESPVDVIVTAP